ncbi:uncharacterized protein LOC111495920 isoform X1 [Cucurbita maxima]|uniref:Uncharacterized protein LOC111495920 isoform X1 n=1 Tax=Cucurbita maxima TaxID=3661 RepID=A0A6J1KMB9_CUCMA|nr:uncharacterized protein LOC111495920 isoform X1 [Cucurbita maxima]
MSVDQVKKKAETVKVEMIELPLLAEQKSRNSRLCRIFPIASLLCLVLFVGSAYVAPDYRERIPRWGIDGLVSSKFNKCENQCRPNGSEPLPKDIVVTASNLEMRPLWGASKHSYQNPVNSSSNLFATAVGIKQKDLVNKMVTKFLSSDFAVMLFHYDGIVDEWKDFDWSNRVIHVTAINQTKWWFAKRFLHPDIVAEYNYIFLWDEDLGVEYFNPKQYVHIIESEGLEISQPALDPYESEVHHQITARGRRSTVHRRTFKHSNGGKDCDVNSKAPPCTGWIEMMAPVFSRAAWRCVWYMIQNDLIHDWGLDMQLGYCAQGDRTKNVGVVDAEYIIHYGRPTLGGPEENETSSKSHVKDHRADVRRQSYIELDVFRKRWQKAAKQDECWQDPYPETVEDNT